MACRIGTSRLTSGAQTVEQNCSRGRRPADRDAACAIVHTPRSAVSYRAPSCIVAANTQ